jgi:predicted GIY-YIG superfamily endonuclease
MQQESEPWFCYMLRCSDGSLYIGMTNDVLKRVEKHNQGLGPEFTKQRRPVDLIWSEKSMGQHAAAQREIELKGWSRKKKLELVARSRIQDRRGECSEHLPRVNPSQEPLAPAQGKGE